jgi:hypothetical protein
MNDTTFILGAIALFLFFYGGFSASKHDTLIFIAGILLLLITTFQCRSVQIDNLEKPVDKYVIIQNDTLKIISVNIGNKLVPTTYTLENGNNITYNALIKFKIILK